jgi:hypothetical protein
MVPFNFSGQCRSIFYSILAVVCLVTATNAATACTCGYKIATMNNTYFKHMVEFDFRKYTSVAQLSKAGLIVTDGWQIGATAPNGAVAWGSPKNIRFSSTDGMLLVVPGGQTAKGHVSAAEVTFNNADKGMTKMYIEADIQVDSKTGTCQSMVRLITDLPSKCPSTMLATDAVVLTTHAQFTYALDYENNFDEHDIEVIAASLMSPSKYAPAGVQLTNFSPDGSGKNQYKIVPFSSNPSIGFHKYK